MSSILTSETQIEFLSAVADGLNEKRREAGPPQALLSSALLTASKSMSDSLHTEDKYVVPDDNELVTDFEQQVRANGHCTPTTIERHGTSTRPSRPSSTSISTTSRGASPHRSGRNGRSVEVLDTARERRPWRVSVSLWVGNLSWPSESIPVYRHLYPHSRWLTMLRPTTPTG